MICKLKEKRKEKKYTQTELGKEVGVSKNTISSYERGEYEPTLKIALKIASTLDCEISELWELI